MRLEVTPKSTQTLYPTDILFQTSFWGRVKSRLGWSVAAFDLALPASEGDVLVLTKRLDEESSMVYVPQGPEIGPDSESYGVFLETLSESISSHLESSAVFIRYDLPWNDPYALDETGGSPYDLKRPENRLREIRMNYSTRCWNLRKAPYDLTVADSLVVDITGTEEEILGRMKPKTRYNIHLSARKGVRVIEADASALPVFYDLYRQTAARNGFPSCDYRHFSALFETKVTAANSPGLFFYLAIHKKDALAGAIIAISGKRATYLFGASANHSRNLMSSYAVQWHAIRNARDQHCSVYDMGAVSPYRDPDHPFFGMYRFKTGFGGHIEHRVGSWDYPLNQEKYDSIRNREMLRSFLMW
ncbi:MAG: peptidoglycan bridge formation glycyltransferase FemA/FemB family protein [Acidobacteria bacterium]|nr:peptidoglycan bridge formation glycyltransferase FemA/FemB family protein [Acidobacteriota bacterium]